MPQDSAQKLAFSKYEIHAVANLFPPMGESEYIAFREGIRAIGQTDPIWTWQGKVIDGRHRLRACNELGIEPKTCEWDGKGSLIAFVVARNLTRRHLDESQRAMVAARLKPAFEKDAQQRVLAGKELDPSLNLYQGRTTEQAGEILNVSRASVSHASRVLANGVPELIAAVDRSEIAVSKAALIAQFSKEQQSTSSRCLRRRPTRRRRRSFSSASRRPRRRRRARRRSIRARGATSVCSRRSNVWARG
jgi:hypothetical protein